MKNSYWKEIKRRKSNKIMVGNIPVGGDSPITVQSMTNTSTADLKATINQVKNLENVGADLVRISCPDQESSFALKNIIAETKVPIIADIHFHYKRAIEAAESGASCLRFNPGNIGSRERILEVVKAARDNDCSIRIGVNAGSLEKKILEKYKSPSPEAMVESALMHENILKDLDFNNYKISVKASNVLLTVEAYKKLALKTKAPLHLGITEAGGMIDGTIKSSIGIGQLLSQGIGDTIRVSLSADPIEEIKVGFGILKSLGLRHRGVTIISCPSCARQGFDVIETVQKLEKKLSHITESVTLSVMGCVVNGPGEALMTEVGFTGGGKESGMLYIDGNRLMKCKNDDMIDTIVGYVEEKIQEKANSKKNLS
ncbi:MAG: flavodoxin-dependent (E)-4-hydroxy-3-methylbut-2-enyl-diphosphate synthase [Pseudomonadota bacterium]|nr:flavodoxin-dependent (E)-4-hydroxy-3-methylbut-2-enyl-diphosphate synthase [Pseudomonadota bacterium]